MAPRARGLSFPGATVCQTPRRVWKVTAGSGVARCSLALPGQLRERRLAAFHVCATPGTPGVRCYRQSHGWSALSAGVSQPWRLLVALDFSDASQAAFSEARRLAMALGATVVLLHAYKPGPPGRTLASLSSQGELPLLREQAHMHMEEAAELSTRWAEVLRRDGITVEVDARDGPPARVILDAARDQNVDLVIVGRQGLGRVGRFLVGSVSQEVSKHSPVPVVIVPEPEDPARKTA